MTPLDWMLVEAFVRSFAPQGPVLEMGSFQLLQDAVPSPGLRRFFPAETYIGSDFRTGPGVDCVMDATAPALRQGTVRTVIMVSTIEHVWRVADAFQSAFEMLDGGGTMVVSSHMDKSIHAYPSDYWRFTPEAIARLLAPFTARLVGFQGRANHPVNVFGVGFNKPPHDFGNRAKIFRRDVEQAMKAYAQSAPLTVKLQRLRRLALWRLFGPKSSYRALRDEHAIGWHCFPD